MFVFFFFFFFAFIGWKLFFLLLSALVVVDINNVQTFFSKSVQTFFSKSVYGLQNKNHLIIVYFCLN